MHMALLTPFPLTSRYLVQRQSCRKRWTRVNPSSSRSHAKQTWVNYIFTNYNYIQFSKLQIQSQLKQYYCQANYNYCNYKIINY